MATPTSFIDRLTLTDTQDLRRELGRSHHDLGDCLLAYDASVMIDILSRMSDTEIARIIGGEDLTAPDGSTPPVLLMMVGHIQDTTESLKVENGGDQPTALEVLKRLRGKLEWQKENGGDYLTFLAYIEFLFRRWENPKLQWKAERDKLSSTEGRNAVLDRIADWKRDQLDTDLAVMEKAEDDAVPLATDTDSTEETEAETEPPSLPQTEGEWK